jgi:hypothetical protein
MPYTSNRDRKLKKNVNATKKVVDGITFASKLEAYMYTLLKDNDIEFTYEGETFSVLPSFKYEADCYEYYNTRTMQNSKGKTVLGIKYTPDFVGPGFIIECKGRANERFPLRWKLFKQYIQKERPGTSLYMPKNDKDCLEVIALLKKK